jgi:hypothetical protein
MTQDSNRLERGEEKKTMHEERREEIRALLKRFSSAVDGIFSGYNISGRAKGAEDEMGTASGEDKMNLMRLAVERLELLNKLISEGQAVDLKAFNDESARLEQEIIKKK